MAIATLRAWFVIFNTASGDQAWWLTVARTRRGAVRVTRRRMPVRLALEDVREVRGAWAVETGISGRTTRVTGRK